MCSGGIAIINSVLSSLPTSQSKDTEHKIRSTDSQELNFHSVVATAHPMPPNKVNARPQAPSVERPGSSLAT